MRHWLSTIAHIGQEIVFPDTCASCGVSGTWMCRDCDARNERIKIALACKRCGSPQPTCTPTCKRCATWDPALVECRSAFAHEGPARQAVLRLKYSGERARAEWCASVLAGSMTTVLSKADMLVPVPLHEHRIQRRGFNQSEEIARRLGLIVAIPFRNALVRVRRTRAQVELAVDERRENLKDAFASTDSLAGVSVVLVDDVVTTGSTLCAAANACLLAGASEVRAITVTTGT